MYYTYQYQQPSEYQFSLDSIYFAEFLANTLKFHENISSLHLLDLCAGCGVLGFQLSWFLKELKNIDFIEVQEIYASFFNQNVAVVNRPELQLRWLPFNYDRLLDSEWQNKYDLIISNPPYFKPGHGVLSPSAFKNRCRFFIDSTYENFILAMENTLNINGQAYFLQRPLTEHGYNLFSDVGKILKDKPVSIQKIAQIRSTDVILMTKHSDNIL